MKEKQGKRRKKKEKEGKRRQTNEKGGQRRAMKENKGKEGQRKIEEEMKNGTLRRSLRRMKTVKRIFHIPINKILDSAFT